MKYKALHFLKYYNIYWNQNIVRGIYDTKEELRNTCVFVFACPGRLKWWMWVGCTIHRLKVFTYKLTQLSMLSLAQEAQKQHLEHLEWTMTVICPKLGCWKLFKLQTCIYPFILNEMSQFEMLIATLSALIPG